MKELFLLMLLLFVITNVKTCSNEIEDLEKRTLEVCGDFYRDDKTNDVEWKMKHLDCSRNVQRQFEKERESN